MTLKELDGECDVCPIKEFGLCPGGWTCYGGEPIEPPCVSIDEDEDLDVWVSEALYQRNVHEMYLRQQEQLEKARKAAEIRRQMKLYCSAEIADLKRAKKALKSFEASVRFAQTWATAFNVTNEMFRYEDRAQLNPKVDDTLQQLKDRIQHCEEAYKAKRKEFYARRKQNGTN